MKRAVIQNNLTPAVTAAVKQAAQTLGFDPKDKDHARRVFRALVGVAAQALLDEGAPPRLVAGEALRAVAEEVEVRANTAVAHGNPFGLPPPASA